MAGLLISTVLTGGLALPAIMFTAGAGIAVSSAFLLAASVMIGAFTLLGIAYGVMEKCCRTPNRDVSELDTQTTIPNKAPSPTMEMDSNTSSGNRFFGSEPYSSAASTERATTSQWMGPAGLRT
jgi:hypothetical protein